MHLQSFLPAVACLVATFVPSASAAAVQPVEQAALQRRDPRAVAEKRSSTSLVPFPPEKLIQARNVRRDVGNNHYALATEDTWYWSLKGASAPNARVKCAFQNAEGQDKNGKSVGIERIMDDIESLTCEAHSLSLKFKNHASYQRAKNQWHWVNRATAHYIAMVIKAPQCGGHRIPYKISSYQADDDSYTINAHGPVVDFKDAFPVLSLDLSNDGFGEQKLVRRLDKSLSIPIGHDFTSTIFSQQINNNLAVSLDCSPCNTAGNLVLDAHVDFSIFPIPSVTGSITARPQGISATVGLGLGVTGTINTAFEKAITLVDIGLPGGINIPAIGNLGPSLSVNMQAGITNVTATVKLNLGSVTMSIDDNSQAVLDFNNQANDRVSGFTPSFSTQGPSIDAEASISASFGTNIVLGVEAEVFGFGIAAGLALAAPTLTGTAGVNINGCPGVEFDAGLGAQLNAFGGIGKVAQVAAQNTISIIGTSTQIFSTCLTIPGVGGGAPASPTSTDPTTDPTQTADPSQTVDPTPTVDPPADPSGAPQPQPNNGVSGGTLGVVLGDAGCKALGALGAPALCGAGVDAQCTGFVNLCCGTGSQCNGAQDNKGVTGQCCFAPAA